ncbi:multifunctional CCA addition/repair protein [Halopseudomonas nanhaiensis]|uniref:multifunctional CCA addition/repair protein n=1 Tax=Halopseudomonas nanhaiensis TaxID=2830842 RepID=UPI001CBDAFB4|nr:multifunctional CCA addition/repair protein [Halopseudomonas nanhaiensis]UAW98762.1 multifunctional CCA addition/repair protein [Halopseudomonas nanhaiensis]
MTESFKRYLVGGAVRDQLLGRPVTERDWVVVGATPEDMTAAGYRPVGQGFPVFIDPATGEEYALARTERKSGRGYGGFVFHTSPDVTLEQDLIRRDLTINAMALADDGSIIDPYGGQPDLQRRLLRHVSPAFGEDPLRVLRVARFAARYADLGFRVADETLQMMRGIAESGELQALTPERSWKEISRALMEARPDAFFETLGNCGSLPQVFPELQRDRPEEDLLATLKKAAELDLPLPARWACLLENLAGCSDGDRCQREDVTRVAAANRRFKVPRDCQDLALLTARFQPCCIEAQNLPALELLELFKAFDIYRRPERFEQFLGSCQAIQRSDGQAGTHYLRQAVETARGVGVDALLKQGLNGAELGEALQNQRLQALKAHQQHFSQ